MRFAKRLLMGVGAVALAAVLLSVAAPKATHAIVATAVQVVNTTANPAVTEDADKATRIPYQSSGQGTDASLGGPCAGVDVNCAFSITTPPAGYRLVIENVSALMYVKSGNPAPEGTILSANANSLLGATFFSGSYLGSSFQQDIVNQAVKRYVNAGDDQLVFITADFNPSKGYAWVTVTGYLENCAVTGCPPIQN
jgi:hypothetical protein